MNNPVYDYADDNHVELDYEMERALGDVDNKPEVLFHSMDPNTSQIITSSETTAHDIMHAHCPMADSVVKLEENHYEMENGKVR